MTPVVETTSAELAEIEASIAPLVVASAAPPIGAPLAPPPAPPFPCHKCGTDLGTYVALMRKDQNDDCDEAQIGCFNPACRATNILDASADKMRRPNAEELLSFRRFCKDDGRRVSTGLPTLDRNLGTHEKNLTSGLVPGFTYVVKGVVGVGRSTFVSQIAARAVQDGPVAYITADEFGGAVARRLFRLDPPDAPIAKGYDLVIHELPSAMAFSSVLAATAAAAPYVIVLDGVGRYQDNAVEMVKAAQKVASDLWAVLLVTWQRPKRYESEDVSVVMRADDGLSEEEARISEIAGEIEHTSDAVILMRPRDESGRSLIGVTKNRAGDSGGVDCEMTSTGFHEPSPEGQDQAAVTS
jgi:predicted ATP-dependent serine protease